MRKTLIYLGWLLYIITGPCHSSQQKLTKALCVSDTSVVAKLLFEDDKKRAAAIYISKYLACMGNPDGNQFSSSWLDLAIYAAWSDSTACNNPAYIHYISSSNGQTDFPQLKANRLLFKSLCLSASGNNNQAADSLLESISLRPEIGKVNRILLADSYGKLARLYKETGDYAESSRYFTRSIELNRLLGRKKVMANDLTDVSSVLSKMDKDDVKADSVLNESLRIYSECDSLEAVAQVFNELGVLFNRRGDIPESLKFFMKSLKVKSKIPRLGLQEFIKVNNNIGYCHQDLDNSDSARFYFRKAIDYAVRSGQNPAKYYINLGASYGGEEKYTPAIENFQKALKYLDPICSLSDLSTNPRITNVTPEIAEFTGYKAHALHRRFGQFKNPDDLVVGLKTFMTALEMMDTLRFMYSFESKPFLSSDAKIHFFNALDMSLDLYHLTGKRTYLDQAFQLSERNKSAILNEFIRTNKAREFMGNIAPWIRVEDSLKLEINKIKSKLDQNTEVLNYQDSSTSQMQIQLSKLMDRLKSVGAAARKQSPEYAKMVYSSQGYPPEDIQMKIHPGEALIDYTVVRNDRLGEDYMTIFVLTRDTLFTFQDTLPNQFRKDIDAFRKTITAYVNAQVFQDYSRLANLMYRYFFAPIDQLPRINHLIILPDEQLGFLPFETFVSDTIKPKGSDFRKLNYLNRKYQISYISSHEQFYQFRSNPKKKAKSIIYSFAPFAHAGTKVDNINLSPLENSGKEVSGVSKYYKTKTYTDMQAGELTLRQTFQKESVVVLSTHGIVNSTQPMRSRLILNPSEPDGSLYLFEMMSLKVKSSLIILNACNTGTGELQVGEGVMSMARGFQFAGVPSVITTLWPIDDQSSAIVMNLFFGNLHDGMSQQEALMRARNTYIDNASKATAAPYFWAGQVLIGDPGFLSIQRRVTPSKLIIFIFLAALTLAVVAALYKKVQ